MYTAISLLLLTALAHCQNIQFAPDNNGETLRNLILTDSKLFLGTDQAVYRINLALSKEQRRQLGTPNRLLVADNPNGTLNGTVLTCDEDTCLLLETSNLNSIKWQVPRSSMLLSGGGLVKGSFSLGPNSTSDITFAEPPNGIVSGRFVKGALRNVNSVNIDDFFTYAVENVGSNANGRTDAAKDTFLYANYTYFTIQPEDEVRVARFCQRDPAREMSFLSHYQIKLRCRANVMNNDIISSTATFKQTAQGPMVFLTVNTMAGPTSMVSEVCAFNVDQINALILDKLTTCAGGDGLVGIGDAKVPNQDGSDTCPSHFTTEQQEIQINDPCSLRSTLVSGLEVDSPLVKPPLITSGTSSMEQHTAILATELDGSLFLFTGTSTGNVSQYHVTADSQSELVRTLSVGGTSVSQLLSSDNGEYVYIMTQNRLHRHTVDMCSTFTSCGDCTSSPDPVCGWCALTGRCTRETLCTSVKDQVNIERTVWIQETASCPVITMATPEIIYYDDVADTLGTSMDVVVSTTNMVPFQFNFECQFLFPGSTVTRTAARSGNMFTCKAPLSNEVPDIPAGLDSVEAVISLQIAGSPPVTLATSTTPLEITDCSLQKTCIGCINSGQDKCRWCPFSHQCIPDPDRFTCTDSADLVTIGQNNQCPQIKEAEYFIHVGHTYSTAPLRVTTSDLSTFRNQFDQEQFQCVLCGDSVCDPPLFSVPASLEPSGGVVYCDANTYTTPLSETELSTELRIVGQGDRRIDNPNDTIVMLYDCGLLGGNCGQCLAIPDAYSCAYCSDESTCTLEARCQGESYSDPAFFGVCDDVTITSISPEAGPFNGGTILTIQGTNLGSDLSHIQYVRVGEAECTVVDYTPGVMIQCRTSAIDSNTYSDRVSLRIQVNGGSESTVVSQQMYMYETPTLNIMPAVPAFGPRAGGSNVTIMGSHLHIGSNHSVSIGGEVCQVIRVDLNRITCTTTGGNEGMEGVRVNIDEWSEQIPDVFEYLPDPTFASIQPRMSFAAGGTNYTVRGTNLHSVQNPRMLIHVGVVSGQGKRQTIEQPTLTFTSEMCISEGTTILYCPAPSVDLNGSTSTSVGFGLLMDDVATVTTLNGTLTVHSDPVFTSLGGELMFGQNDPVTLTIEGEGFLFTLDQVRVRLSPCTTPSGECYCTVTNITEQNTLICEMDNPSELSLDQSLTVTVVIGAYEQLVGTIRIQQGPNLLLILIPVFAGVLVLSAAIFIVLVAVFCRNARQKDQKYDQLILELEKLESSVARECKLGFAELQTDLDEITDIAGCRLPYRDMQTYLLTTLFPGAKDHPVLHPIQAPSHRLPQLHRALEDFNYLIHDKKVLLLLVRSLEAERSFNMRDKSVVGSLLIVALINRFDYATDILKSLLSDLIHKNVSNSSPKLLLRRTETVAERMLTNWLAFCLHGYIMEHVGQPLYLTYRAVKTQLEKGPVDVITGEARYSLSEQKLIRQKVDVEVVDVFVDSEDGLRVPVKLLDCDTVSQVKVKLLDATYKTAPISQRPTLKTVDLVYIVSPTEQHILRDEDPSMQREGTWKRINTLKHYSIRNGGLFRLVRRKEHPGPGRAFDYPGSLISSHTPRQRALSEAEDGTRVWHLFKQMDVEDPRRSPFLNKKMVSEIYLPRMLSTKSILQKFVDDLFKSLFTMSHPPVSPTARYSSMFPQSPGVQVPMGYAPGADAVPMAVKYLFDFLDDEAEAAKIVDQEAVHTWKNNALSLRFWVNMIKNPEFVFDINKSHTVDACLSVIAQAFIDGCSYADTKLNIDSPTSKLLYNKEVQGYRAQVKQYYQDIRHLPRVPEDAMQYYLKQLSVYQSHITKSSGGFVVESALYELLRYVSRYSDQIAGNLRSAGLEAKAQTFDGIVKVFNS